MLLTESSTLSALIEQFLDAKIAEGRSVRTIEAYRHRCTRFATWLGTRPITRATLRGYLASLQHEAYSPFTVAAYFRDVKVLVRWLLDEQLLHDEQGNVVTTDPTHKIKPHVPQRRPASYSVEQLHRLLAFSDDRTAR
jgi:site-specific recombinase XerD